MWALCALFVCSFSFLQAQSVEICTNGIDDDGDGLIDCYDQECTCTAGQCDNFYYTTCNADCFYVPPCGQISLGVQWVGQAETGTYSTLVAGDMDADGIPEIVTYRVENAEIYIIDGATGATKLTILSPVNLGGGTAPAIADLDNDGFGEIVIIANDQRMRCYEHDGTLKYTTNPVGYNPRYRFSVPNIADFNHDGLPEVNVGNQVYNGQTGALLASGGASLSAGEHPKRASMGFSFNMPVAMDVLPDSFCPDCAGLEIVAGNQVLSVNLTTGAVTAVVTAPAPFTDGFTSLADFDRDGDLDAIVQGEKNGLNTLYCWDIQTSTILREFTLPTNWAQGASRANIADLNGDGELEVSFVEFPRLYALRNDFSFMWEVVSFDASSITCSSVFDFCGDGSADIVYRGQEKLQVINGATGQISWEDNCRSATHIENPLVLDVDGDGQTEIVIECGTNGSPDFGRVVVYEAIGSPGIASRRVWNQHAYFNTNINDDLSVPAYQQNPSIIGDSLRMNTFLNQYFNPTFPSPDGVLSLTGAVCVGDSMDVSLTLCNIGDNVLPPLTPVSFYQGNPQTTAANWLGALPLGFELFPDSCRSFTARVPRVANDSIFVVLNDDNSLPAPFNLSLDFPVTPIGECGFVNNIVSFYLPYNPAAISLGPDTLICDNATVPLDASGNDLVSWLWNDNSTAPSFTAPDAGTFSVTVTDVCGILQIDSIVVEIDSSTVVDIGADVAICQGETVTLSETGFDTYTWSPSGAVDCATCPVVVTGPPATTSLVLIATLNNGCFSTDTLLLTVNDTFNYQIDTVICYGRTVDWNGITIPPDSVVTFNLQTFAGCDSVVTINVIGTTVGTFQVAVDTAICLGSTLQYNGLAFDPGDETVFYLSAITGCDSTVMLRVLPKDTFATMLNLTICDGETFDIFGQQIGVSGIYQQTFTAQNGCDSTHTYNLNVLPTILLALEAEPTCFGEAVGTVTATTDGGTPPYQLVWSTGETSTVIEDLPAGNYAITLTDAAACSVEASTLVTAHPAIDFSAQTDSVQCFGDANGAISVATSAMDLLFSINGAPYTQTLYYPNLEAGDYLLYAQDMFGCVDTLDLEVGAPLPVSVSLPGDASVILGETVQINVNITAEAPLVWMWSDTSGLTCYTCPETVLLPLVSNQYTLSITDANGCTGSDSMYVDVKRISLVYMPNVFLPESSGTNAYFTPSFGPAITRVRYLRVFDRWGNLLYQVENAAPDGTGVAWDGRSRGDYVLPGVYAWMMELELVDDTVEKYRGDVTVIR